MPKTSNQAIAKAVRLEFPVLTEFDVYRSPAGYFYAQGKARIGGEERYLDVESEYTFSLGQRTFAEWIDLWSGKVEKALDAAGAKYIADHRLIGSAS